MPGIEDPTRLLERFLGGGPFSVQTWAVCALWLVCALLAAPRSAPWAALLAVVSLNEFVAFRDLSPDAALKVTFVAAALGVPAALVFGLLRPAFRRESLAAGLFAASVCAATLPLDSWLRFAGEAAELVAGGVLAYALADALADRASTTRTSPT
ncbi:MAG: hypothetical protein JRG76_06280 [Deltaproteobacteria bacterium]|nr:hypothetical protein [Deltaproteobacteria bacterium]MBW2414102.1 hypothetical protein [Deltaproteobacteria bacterium]